MLERAQALSPLNPDHAAANLARFHRATSGLEEDPEAVLARGRAVLRGEEDGEGV